MNYIKQVKAFYDRLEENPLSTSAIALWHALMHANNKAGWTEEFSVAASLLCFRSGLAERTVSKARNELKQKGFIDFRSRKGNRSAIYKIMDLSASDAGNHADKEPLSAPHAVKCADNHADSRADKYADNHATLLNKTKQNKKEAAADAREDAVAFFANNFGNTSSFIAESIEQWVRDFDSHEIVIAAMKMGLLKGGRTFGYCESFLREWAEKGLKTIDAVRAYESNKKSEKPMQRKASNISKIEEYFARNGG